MSWREQTVDLEVPLEDDYSLGKAHCTRCGAEWFGFDICHCASCHLTFTSIRPFDRHRVQGRCRTEDELRAKGLEPNENGQWRRPMPSDALQRKTGVA
jgi:hypothetical protein